jgi:hypothetical protein
MTTSVNVHGYGVDVAHGACGDVCLSLTVVAGFVTGFVSIPVTLTRGTVSAAAVNVPGLGLDTSATGVDTPGCGVDPGGAGVDSCGLVLDFSGAGVVEKYG